MNSNTVSISNLNVLLCRYVTSDALNFVVNTVIIQYYCVYYEIYYLMHQTQVDLPINTAHDMDEANEIIKPNHHAPTHNGESEFNIWGVGPWSKSV